MRCFEYLFTMQHLSKRQKHVNSLEEVNKRCVITKSSKVSISTYDYMCLISIIISRFIRLLLDRSILHLKHMGRSIMVSAFICPCHGLMQLPDEQLQMNPKIKQKEAYIIRSVQKDGYWKSEHMLEQV